MIDDRRGSARDPRRLVDVRARCRRCPYPVGEVPLGEIALSASRRGERFVVGFLCPYCRTDAAAEVSLEEALRLYGAGVPAVRVAAAARGAIGLDELVDFAAEAARVDGLARAALEEGLA